LRNGGFLLTTRSIRTLSVVGCCHPSLRSGRCSRCLTISQGCFVQGEVSGTNDVSVFGKIDGTISLKDNILTIEKLSDIKALADYTVELGKSALSGDKGLFYDGLVLAASLILWHTKKADSLVGAKQFT
jgi:hypothetical protein